jgi:hypothetical protein
MDKHPAIPAYETARKEISQAAKPFGTKSGVDPMGWGLLCVSVEKASMIVILSIGLLIGAF